MTIRNPCWTVGGSVRASDGHPKRLSVPGTWRAVIYLVPGVITSMGCIPRVVGVLLLGNLFVVPTVSWSQAARVSVGIANTLAGDTVDIPIYLSAPETVKVGSVVQTISFPKKLLSLTRAQAGPTEEQSPAEVKTKITDASDNADLAVLEVTVSSKAPLRPGILAYLRFKISIAAREGEIPLKIVDTKAATESGDPVQLTRGRDGVIGIYDTVEAMPAVGCFFFTH